jgi:hypothetical protein
VVASPLRSPASAAVVLSLVLIALVPARAGAAAVPIPRAACVAGARGVTVAVFDVRVASKRRVRAPASRITGGRLVGARPRSFAPGTTHGVLRVRFSAARVEWRLGGRSARLARSGPPCSGAASGSPPPPVAPAQAPPVQAPPVQSGPPPPPRSAPAPTPAPRPTPQPPSTPLPPSPSGPVVARSIFAPTSFWNAAVPTAVALAADTVNGKPVNPTVGQELATFAKRKDGSSNTWINYKAYTAPITTVPASARLEPVRLCRSYPSGCLPSWAVSLDRTLRGVARDGHYLGGGVPVPEGFAPPNDTDAEAIFYQPDYVAPDGKLGRVYELWGMRRNPDFDPALPVSATNARWMAAWGGRLVGANRQGVGYWTDCWWSGCGYQADTNADPDAWGRPDSQARDHNWGATATSLSLLGTQVSLDECRDGVIRHAVGIEVPDAHPGAWWPAQRGDGGQSSAVLTEGMRLTFPPGAAKPAGLTAVGSSLWDAARNYGLIIDDKTSSSLNFRVEPGCEKTAWWGRVGAYDQLRGFPWADLRVIARGSETRPNPLANG